MKPLFRFKRIKLQKIFLFICFILCNLSNTFAEEIGFITLFNGQTKYEGQKNSDNMLGSYFLVRVWDEYDIFFGALTFASFSAVSSTSSNTSNGEDSDITISSVFQHRGYGPSLAYVYSTESFIGFQFWLGGNYLTNEADIKHKITEEVEREGGEVFQCTGEDSETAKFNSFAPYLGIGGTINNFGLFVQILQQKVGEISVSSDTDLRCLTGSVVETRTTPGEGKINPSFQSVLFGIHYRF